MTAETSKRPLILGLSNDLLVDDAVGRSYPFIEEPSPRRANYHHSDDPFDAANGATPVGFYNGENHGGFQTIDSPSPCGCYDMAGNVAEWLGDVHEGSHLRLFYGGSMMSYAYNLRGVYGEQRSPRVCQFPGGFPLRTGRRALRKGLISTGRRGTS